MLDEAIITIVVDLCAWFFVAFWLFVWIGFLTSIILARIWISASNDKQQVKSMANKSSATGDPLLPESTFPGVSCLKPLTGSDEVLSHNLESWFKLRYPVFELLFCVHDVDDAAVPIVNALIDKYPGVDAKLVISGAAADIRSPRVHSDIYKLSPVKMPLSPTPSGEDIERQSSNSSSSSSSCSSSCKGTSAKAQGSQLPVAELSTVINPKIRNILPAYESCKYDLVFISDCNIEAEPETLHDVVSKMGPRVATVCQMHFVKDPPSHLVSFGSIVNKVYFGTQNAKAIMFLALLRVTTTVSAAMLIRKSALDECGGLRAFGCYLAEDYHIGLELSKRGWIHKLGSRLAWQNPAKTTVRDVFSRLIRWKRLRQATSPFLIFVDPLSECVVLGLVAAWALSHLIPAVPFLAVFLAHCLAWFFADFLLLSAVNKQPLKFPKFAFLLAWLVRELSAPFLHIASLVSRRVVWRGHEYYLKNGGKTERLPSPPSTPTVPHPGTNRRRTTSLTLTTQQVPVVNIEQAAKTSSCSNSSNSSNNNNQPIHAHTYPTSTSHHCKVESNSSTKSAVVNNSSLREKPHPHPHRHHHHPSSSPPSLCAVNA